MSYVQVAYHGGHVSFIGGKRIAWVYDITALTDRQVQVAEQERQLREILDFCPAGENSNGEVTPYSEHGISRPGGGGRQLPETQIGT